MLKPHSLCNGDYTIHFPQYRFFNQLAIDDNKPGIRGLKFCNDAPCTGNPFGCRCKDFVQGGDLLWMDGPLAGKAQTTRLFGGNTHAIHVIKIKEGYVDDIQPGTGGGAEGPDGEGRGGGRGGLG